MDSSKGTHITHSKVKNFLGLYRAIAYTKNWHSIFMLMLKLIIWDILTKLFIVVNLVSEGPQWRYGRFSSGGFRI